MSSRTIVIRQECLNCGFVGSTVEARQHAETRGCRTFRTYTQVVSPSGRILDERVEVHQLSPPDPRGAPARAA